MLQHSKIPRPHLRQSWARIKPLPIRGSRRANEIRASADVRIPVTYYDILQVQRAASREAVRRSSEQLLNTRCDTQYSSDTLFSRAVMIKIASQSLIDLDLRRLYDQKMLKGDAALRVPHQEVPGALALMQELGRFDSVIESALDWLEGDGARSHPGLRDVAFSMAISYYGRAKEALQTGPSVLSACEDMEKALALMQRYQISPQLQQQVEQTLQDCILDHILDRLALPLGGSGAEVDQRRARGVQMLYQVLRRPGDFLEDAPCGPASHFLEAGKTSSPGAMPRETQRQSLMEDFLEGARTVLTAMEQVELAREVAECPWRPAGSAYDTAMALISVGLTTKRAHLIHKADRLLQSLEHGGDVVVSPVSVERAACAMLMGEPDRALIALGLAGDGPADPEVAAFVQEHSEESSDLLPGLCLLTQRWLQEAVLDSFRDTRAAAGSSRADNAVDLDVWFQDGRVGLYLQVWGLAQASPALLEVAHFMCGIPDKVSPLLAKRGESPDAEKAASRSQQEAATQTQPTMAAANSRGVMVGAASLLSAPGSYPSVSSQSSPDDPDQSDLMEADVQGAESLHFDAQPDQALQPLQLPDAAHDALPGRSSAPEPPLRARSSRDEGGQSAHPAATAALRSQLDDTERAMWDSSDFPPGRQEPPALSLGNVAKVAALGLMLLVTALGMRERLFQSRAPSGSSFAASTLHMDRSIARC